MALTHGPNSLRSALIALSLAIIAAASMLDYHLGYFLPRVLQIRAAKDLGNGYSFGDDFYPIWLAARDWQASRRDPYSREMTRAIQTGLFGRPLDKQRSLDPPADYRSFAYPAFTILVFEPVAAFDFPALRLMLVLLLPLLTIASLGLWMRALGWRPSVPRFVVIALLTLCSYPLLEAFFAAQPGLIVGFFLAAAALALRRNLLFLAGILSALTLIKPQMTALAIAYVLLWSFADRSRIGFIYGFLATLTSLLTSSLMIWPRWIGEWTHVVLGYHRYATPPLVSELLGPTLGSRLGPILVALLLIAGLFLAWRARQAAADSLQFWATVSLLLGVTSIALLPGQAVYDHVILFPGIFLVIQRWSEICSVGQSARILQTLAAAVLFWQWISAFALLLLRPFLAPEHFYSTAIFALPIRTAGSFPFAVLALLLFSVKSLRKDSSHSLPSGRLMEVGHS